MILKTYYYFGPDEINRILNDQAYNYQMSSVKPSVLENKYLICHSGHEAAFNF